MKKSPQSMNRRSFFESIGRGAIFTLLAGTSTYLLMRKREPSATFCDFDFICSNCRKNSFCQLQEASHYRMNKRQEKKNGKDG